MSLTGILIYKSGEVLELTCSPKWETLHSRWKMAVEAYPISLTTPLSFQVGDVLGIFQPDSGKNCLRLYFESGVGPRNYYETLVNNDVVEPPSDMFTLGTVLQNDLPLVAVEISKLAHHCTVYGNLLHALFTWDINCTLPTCLIVLTNITLYTPPDSH